MPNINYVAGIDPGKSGAIAFMPITAKVQPICFTTNSSTPNDLAKRIYNLKPKYVHLETPGGYIPGNGKKSIKELFKNLGIWIGILEALNIEYVSISPQRWMNDLDCRTGGDKRITHRKASELFPKVKVTHAIADALLIAHHAKLVYTKS